MQQKRARRRDGTASLTGVSATATVPDERLTVGTTSVAKRLEGGWEVIYHLGRDARSQWAVTRLELRPAASRPVPEGGVTMKLIRAITIDAARRYARTYRPSTPVRGLATTRRKALARHAQLRENGHRDAAKTVAAEFHVNRSTVRSWIHRASETPNSARRSAHRR